MKIGTERKRALIQLAQRVEASLAAHPNPNGPPGVNPSQVREVLRYVQTRPGIEALSSYLELLPRSALARYTAASGPQLERTCREAASALLALPGIVGPDRAEEGLAYVLGIVAHTLATRERTRPARGRNRRR